MKKFLIFLVLASGLMTSCSQYTCPTYAKSTPQKESAYTGRYNSYERAFARVFADCRLSAPAMNSVSDKHQAV